MQKRLCLLAILAMLAATTPGTALADVGYRSLRIAAPQRETTVHDNNGNLDVNAELVPSLDAQSGDRLQLLLDGALAADADVARGTHKLVVNVRNHSGTRRAVKLDPWPPATL